MQQRHGTAKEKHRNLFTTFECATAYAFVHPMEKVSTFRACALTFHNYTSSDATHDAKATACAHNSTHHHQSSKQRRHGHTHSNTYRRRRHRNTRPKAEVLPLHHLKVDADGYVRNIYANSGDAGASEQGASTCDAGAGGWW